MEHTSNNNIQLFNFNKTNLRTTGTFSDPMFCLNDVCNCLELPNSSVYKQRITERFGEEVTRSYPLQTKGGIQNVTFVNEKAFYYLVMRSDKKEAVAFQDWVFSEVLPTIRKTGSYDVRFKALLAQAREALDIGMVQIERLESLNEQLENKIKQDAPLVSFGTAIATSSDNILIGDLAKLSGKIGRNNLFKKLKENHILCKDNLPRQQYIDSGYFEVTERVVKSVKGDLNTFTTYLTGKGQIWLLAKIDDFLLDN